MYDSQYVILLFLLTAADAEWFNKTESDATVSFFISTHNNDTVYTYPKARTFCRSIGGDIASVLSKEEEDIFVWRLHTHQDGYFIGLKVHYTAVDSTPGFSWDDGSPYNYSNWDALENVDNMCTAYVYNDMSKTWNWKTSHCESQPRFTICKKNFSASVTTTPAVLHSSTITPRESTELQVTTEDEYNTRSNVSDISGTSYSHPTGIYKYYNTEGNTDMSSESVSGNPIQANTLWIGIGASLGVGVVIIIIIIVILVLRRKQNDCKDDKADNHDEIEPTIYDNNSITMTNIHFNNNGFDNNAHVNVNAQTCNQTKGQNNQDVITANTEHDNVYTDDSLKDNNKTPTQEELEGMYAQVNKPDTNIHGNQMLGNTTCDKVTGDITNSGYHSRDVTDKPSQEELEDMYAQVNKPIAAVKPSVKTDINPGYDNHGSNVGTMVPGQHAITTLELSNEPDGEVEFSDNLIYCS